jgi:hypothetical protein
MFAASIGNSAAHYQLRSATVSVPSPTIAASMFFTQASPQFV